jgi:hypothetical protein
LPLAFISTDILAFRFRRSHDHEKRATHCWSVQIWPADLLVAFSFICPVRQTGVGPYWHSHSFFGPCRACAPYFSVSWLQLICLLLALASTVILGSESYRTHDYICLSHNWESCNYPACLSHHSIGWFVILGSKSGRSHYHILMILGVMQVLSIYPVGWPGKLMLFIAR